MNRLKLTRNKLIPGLGILSLALLLTSISYRSNAQQFYIRAGGGYSLKASSSQFNDADPNGLTQIEPSTRITATADGTTVESLRGTLGVGYKVGGVAGYMFNDYIGAELGVYYFHGSEQTIGELSTPAFHSSETAYIRGVDVAPALVVTPGFDGVNPYARVGLLIPVAGDLTIKTNATQMNYEGSGQDLMVSAVSEVQPKFSLGYNAAIGVLFPIKTGVDLFAEAEFKSLTLKSDKAEIKSYKTTLGGNAVPGQQLEDLPVAEKKFTFSDEFTPTDPESNSDQPRVIPTQYVNASGIGFNLGLRFTF
ncbi:outer membrane beta-barrel protein [Fulvivirga ligni]|uniref:outer membrane beta-barrel protein n=1 Tax=Fulvivirga ligni TaxID=2904246 RepID=UPI001F1A3310|nr:outer membrane beta-barrel protein [Fulvivirga ligni]UII19364.1 outer membrane beta-barrel protein [Fulvivirga ligni]